MANVNNMEDGFDKDTIDIMNKNIRAEQGTEKLGSIFASFINMPEGSADKDTASHYIGMVERGFIPVPMRQQGFSNDFIKRNPDFKLDIKYNNKIIGSAVNDRNITDVYAIRSIDNPTKDSVLGNNFGRFMEIDTTRANYLKNEDGTRKDFKEDLYSVFNKDYYDKIDSVYIVNDTPRNREFKNPEQNFVKDIPFGDRVAVEGFVALQITTFEVHKTDGDIEYKSYFTNNAGQILAEMPDSGTAEILLGDSIDSKCEAINTVDIKLENIPKDFDSKLRGASLSTIEGVVYRQSSRILDNAELNKNEVEVLSGNKDILGSVLNCVYAEKYDTMSVLKEKYTELDSKAKDIASEIKVLNATDKSSEEYAGMKASVEEHIEEYKELLIDFDKEYKNTELFDDKKIDNLSNIYSDTVERLDKAESRTEIANSELLDNKNSKMDTLTRFRGIIGIERSSNFGSNIDVEGIKDSASKGLEIIKSKVEEWNETHKDSPLKIEETSSGLKIYDKHGFERNIQDISENNRNFNLDMVDEGASSPEVDENGNVSKEAIDSFIAEDEEVYKEFEEGFELSDIVIDRDYESLIEKYTDDTSIDFKEYGLDNSEIKKNLTELNGEKIEDSAEDKEDYSTKEYPYMDLDEYRKMEADAIKESEEDAKNEKALQNRNDNGKDKIDTPRADSKHINLQGKIEISDEKKEAIKKEIEKELKGVSNDKYQALFDKMYSSRVVEANAKLEAIADKINNHEKGVKYRTERLGSLSHSNWIMVNERSKVDGLIDEYKKAGGAIGKDNFVVSVPTWLDKFSRAIESTRTNLLETAITETFLKIDNVLHPDRKEPYEVDTNRDNLTSNEERPVSNDKENIIKNNPLNNIETSESDTPKDVEKKDTDKPDTDSNVSNDDKKDIETKEDDAKVIKDIEETEKVEAPDDKDKDNERPENIDNDSKLDKPDEDKDNDVSKENVEDSVKDEDKPETVNEENDKDSVETSPKEDDTENKVDNTENDNEDKVIAETTEPEEINDGKVDNVEQNNTAQDDDIDKSAEPSDKEEVLSKDDEKVDNEKAEEDNKIEKNDKEDDSAAVEDSERTEDPVTKDTDIPEEYEDKEDDDIESNEDERKEKITDEKVEDKKEDDEKSIIDDIKAEIKEKIEDYFEGNDTIGDKLESYLENFSPMELIDICMDAVVDFFTSIIEMVNGDNFDSTDFEGKASELFSDLSQTIADNTEQPDDFVREEVMDKVGDSELPDNISENIINGINVDSDGIGTDFGETDGTNFSTISDMPSDTDDVTTDIEKSFSSDFGVDTDVANDSKYSVAVDNATTDLENSGFSSEDSYNMAEDAVGTDIDNGLSFDDGLELPTDDSVKSAVQNYENSDNSGNDTELTYSNNDVDYLNNGYSDYVETYSEDADPNLNVDNAGVDSGQDNNDFSDRNTDDFDAGSFDVGGETAAVL